MQNLTAIVSRMSLRCFATDPFMCHTRGACCPAIGLAHRNRAIGDRTMTKDEIKIGGNYLAKVTDRVVPIRIDALNRHGGWDATNLVTNKQIRIKSAQRLRGPADKKSAKAVAKAQEQDAAANAHAVAPEVAPVKTPDKENKTAKPKVAKLPKEPKADKGLSCLDAAAQVLKDKGEPMQCKAMIDAMFHRQTLEQRRAHAARHAVLGDPPGDHHQGIGVAVQEDRARAFRIERIGGLP